MASSRKSALQLAQESLKEIERLRKERERASAAAKAKKALVDLDDLRKRREQTQRMRELMLVVSTKKATKSQANELWKLAENHPVMFRDMQKTLSRAAPCASRPKSICTKQCQWAAGSKLKYCRKGSKRHMRNYISTTMRKRAAR